MRLLLVEDEIEIQSFLRRSLTEAGYEVETASDARTAERLATADKHDVLIVDLGLPDKDGIDLILRLRQMGVSAPVLILSARRSVDDRVRGLEQGGDDYLTKPFALAELLARLRNLLKRHAPGSEVTRLRVLDLELDLLRREASRKGEKINLTPQEFTLLEYLCRNPGRVVTRSMILDKVWGMRIQPDTNVVDVHIYRLRGKVDAERPFVDDSNTARCGLCPSRQVNREPHSAAWRISLVGHAGVCLRIAGSVHVSARLRSARHPASQRCMAVGRGGHAQRRCRAHTEGQAVQAGRGRGCRAGQSREVPDKLHDSSGSNAEVFFLQTTSDGTATLWVGTGERANGARCNPPEQVQVRIRRSICG